jgi:hypothetical protein
MYINLIEFSPDHFLSGKPKENLALKLAKLSILTLWRLGTQHDLSIWLHINMCIYIYICISPKNPFFCWFITIKPTIFVGWSIGIPLFWTILTFSTLTGQGIDVPKLEELLKVRGPVTTSWPFHCWNDLEWDMIRIPDHKVVPPQFKVSYNML